jgi:uncharacterized protein YeaO (DUF488 family)
MRLRSQAPLLRSAQRSIEWEENAGRHVLRGHARDGADGSRTMTTTIQIKRAYEPAARGDGRRVLVERLWPRGMKKNQLDLDEWLKDVAPSTPLRQWYGHDVERWPEFQRRYRSELRRAPGCDRLLRAAHEGRLTLLYSAHDQVHNSAHVLRDFLERRIRASATKRRPTGRHGSRTRGHVKRRVRGARRRTRQ